MKRLWLKVDGIRVRDISRMDGGLQRASFAVRLGDVLTVRGVEFGKRDEEKATCPFWQNWAMADTRFLDVPALHRHHPLEKKDSLLSDVLALALMERLDGLVRVLETLEKGGQQIELDYLWPAAWQGKSLRIPVDFVRIQNFECRYAHGKVTADVWAGHHFVVWHVPVFDGAQFAFDPERRIGSEKLLALIGQIMARRTFRRHVRAVSADGFPERKRKFTLAVKGYDTERIPPAIRFY